MSVLVNWYQETFFLILTLFLPCDVSLIMTSILSLTTRTILSSDYDNLDYALDAKSTAVLNVALFTYL
jgi:hypothetical protein